MKKIILGLVVGFLFLGTVGSVKAAGSCECTEYWTGLGCHLVVDNCSAGTTPWCRETGILQPIGGLRCRDQSCECVGFSARDVFVEGYENTGFRFASGEVGDVVSAILPYIYTAAGLLLLIMLIMGGIELMTAGNDPGKAKSGYGKITGGLIGFAIIFISYFVAQLVEVVLGVKFL